MWNLHVMTLLIMLARNTKSGGSFQEDYVRPVTYTCRSLDNDLETEDNNDNVLDSLTHFSDHEGQQGQGGQNQQRPDSNLKRRQSSEDFLEMQAAREFQQYCMEHHPDLMYNPRYDQVHSHQYHFDDDHHHHHHHDSHVMRYDENSSRYDDFSSSPDPFEEEAMVDDEDPLEIARQGTKQKCEIDFF